MKAKASIVIAAGLALLPAAAAAGGGGGFSGATEITQLLNNAQLVQQYAQQVIAYENQLQQYATMIKNLAANPLGVPLRDIQQLAINAGKLMEYGTDIGSSLSRIDQHFATTFSNTVAQNYADRFKVWTATSQDGLKVAMRNAGMQREKFPDDISALESLATNLAQSGGNLSAIQALGAINAQQVQEAMKLRMLITEQQTAQNNYLLAQAKKQEELEAINEKLTRMPPPESYEPIRATGGGIFKRPTN